MVFKSKAITYKLYLSGQSNSGGTSGDSAGGKIGEDYAAGQSEVYSSGQNSDDDSSSQSDDSSEGKRKNFPGTKSARKTAGQSTDSAATKSDDFSSQSENNSSEDHSAGQSEFSVLKGGSVKLKCTPTHKFSNCKFLSPSGKIFISKAKLKYEDGRIQCLCNVSYII